jgi:hypothetical protein
MPAHPVRLLAGPVSQQLERVILAARRYIFWLAGGTRPFMRRYTASCP